MNPSHASYRLGIIVPFDKFTIDEIVNGSRVVLEDPYRNQFILNFTSTMSQLVQLTRNDG
jgi:hypothetical protein